ncbi:aminotransferase class I/II-fold pyridoxal phosphate-dependent enzyme [Candidatus Woesearchaeota archaeon]|nr:aminotransferase class I/II-fold pyridoxal phosphate-dependent enzyme [Candidatus Woesearchaeota archaeon]MBW3021652.1 aminotransferase class I/II-fold pyridoxal phosphate-dependent enzyme [Candidatus Woesearchaeota archaeon]
MREISEREQELPDAVIGKLLKIAAEDKSVISLGPGEPDFPLPKPLVAEVKRVADKINHYSPPGGRSDFKEAIIRKLKNDNRIKANPENIIVTCGSQEGLALATACTLDVSEQIILPNPSFMGFLPTFELFNAVPRFVDVYEENGFAFDPDDIKKQVDRKKTNALLINSPANPTGTVFSKKLLEEIADLAIEYNFYIFSDEAYEKILYDNAKHISIGSLNGMEPYVLTFHSFSKTYAMCGFRLGYCVGPEDVVQAMTKSHIYTTICAPTVSQLVGLKALSLSSKYTDAMVKEYNRRRKMIIKRLNELNLRVAMPKGAFYAFTNIKEYSNNSRFFADQLLKKAKVAVVPGTDFGNNGEGYVRCSYATDYKLIEIAMDRIADFLKKR